MKNEQSNDDEIEKEQKIFHWKCNTPNCGKTAVTESEDFEPPGITEPGTEPGDFEIPSQYAGDDTDDRLNKYDMDQAGNYKLDPKSVVQPDKKKSDSLFKQFTDWAKGTKWYDIATTNPKVKTLPATVQDKSNTSKQSVMDLAKKIEADPKFQAQSSDEKAADIAQMAANNAAQRAEIYRRLNNK